MKTKNDLFVSLDKFFNTTKYSQGGLSQVSNETYGRKSCIYVALAYSMRQQLEDFLFSQGFKVNKSYWPGQGVVEIQVAYFRGVNHNV
jgi:hypothetical protein